MFATIDTMSLYQRLIYLYYGLLSRFAAGRALFSEPWPRLLVLDFSYEGTSGHHHALNKLLTSAGKEAGWHVHVLANRNIAPSLLDSNTDPLFTRGTYGAVGKPKQARKKMRRTIRSFVKDMLEAGLDRIPADTTVLIHTASAPHILATVGFLSLAKRKCPTNIYLMLPPDFDAASPAQAEQRRQYEQAFRLAAGHPHVRFLCENRLLKAAYQGLGCEHIALLDLPCRLPDTVFERPRTGRMNFLFIGDPRPEKGLQLILDAIPLLEPLAGRITIKLLLTHPEKSRSIAPLLEGREFVELVAKPFFSEAEYFQALGQADCVLLPYDPQAYLLKNSNMVSEALGCGTPVIVPPGPNSLSDYCKATGTSVHVEMKDHSPEGFAQAIGNFLTQAPALQSKASLLRQQIIESRDPRHFIDRIARIPA